MNRAKLRAASEKAALKAAALEKRADSALRKLFRTAKLADRLRKQAAAARRRAHTAEALYRDSWRRQPAAPVEEESPN